MFPAYSTCSIIFFMGFSQIVSGKFIHAIYTFFIETIFNIYPFLQVIGHLEELKNSGNIEEMY